MEKTIKRSTLMNKLGAVMSIRNLVSPRSWRPVANQFESVHRNGTSFQSYETLIAVRLGGKLYLTDAHDCSKTTSKYATEWTGYNTSERRIGLEEGRFIRIVED